MRYQVTTPVGGFSGEVAGVVFRDSVAEVTEDRRSALAYFRRRGYRVEPVGAAPTQAIPRKPGGNAPKADWVAWAVSHGAEQADAEQSSKTDLVERYG